MLVHSGSPWAGSGSRGRPCGQRTGWSGALWSLAARTPARKRRRAAPRRRFSTGLLRSRGSRPSMASRFSRKVIKNRGHFPNDAAAVTLLWLPICNIEDERTADRAKERSVSRGAKRTAEGRLVERHVAANWMKTLGQLSSSYVERSARPQHAAGEHARATPVTHRITLREQTLPSSSPVADAGAFAQAAAPMHRGNHAPSRSLRPSRRPA